MWLSHHRRKERRIWKTTHMEDETIIRLYFNRDERAISETDRKYGSFCHRIALNILRLKEDAEECVNDTWHAVWNKIPPDRPVSFKAYLGRITRNLSVSRYRANHAQKRSDGGTLLLSELEDCIPSPESVEETVKKNALSAFLDRWLLSLPEEDRALFVRRYWYGDSLGTLAKLTGSTEKRLAQKMLRLRLRLKKELEKGVYQ